MDPDQTDRTFPSFRLRKVLVAQQGTIQHVFADFPANRKPGRPAMSWNYAVVNADGMIVDAFGNRLSA